MYNKKLFFVLALLLFVFQNMLAQQGGESVNFIILNDSTVFCVKKNTDFLLQFNKGKIKNKSEFLSFFNVKEKNDTILWNNVVSKVIKNQIKPDVSLYVQYKTNNNSEDSFIWFVKRNNELRQFSSHKSKKETNFFNIDPFISLLTGKNLKSDNIEYKNILKSIAGYSHEIKNTPTVWKDIRDSLRNKLNKEDYNYKLINYKDDKDTIQNIFIHKIQYENELPIYNYDSRPKTIEPQAQIARKEENIFNLHTLYFFLSGLLLTLLVLCVLYFIFRKNIDTLLISKKAHEHIESLIPALWNNKEAILKPEFEKIHKKFIEKFEIYNDVSSRLNIQSNTINEEAFQNFIKLELSKILSEKNNIKELLETDDITDMRHRLDTFEIIFKELYDIEELNFKEQEHTKLPQKIKVLFKELSKNREDINKLTNDNNDKKEQITILKKEQKEINAKLTNESYEIEKYKKFHAQFQENINIIRKLDNLFERKGANKDNSKDDKNNIVFSILQIRSLLNLLYCTVSNNNIQYQIDNLRYLNRDKDKEIEKLIENLNSGNKCNELLFELEKGNYYNSLSLYQKIHKLFNSNLNKFPDDYYFGIEDDKHF